MHVENMGPKHTCLDVKTVVIVTGCPLPTLLGLKILLPHVFRKTLCENTIYNILRQSA